MLLSEDLDASTAALRVGYDNASQFTREYKRLFGDPPMRYVSRFKQSDIGDIKGLGFFTKYGGNAE